MTTYAFISDIFIYAVLESAHINFIFLIALLFYDFEIYVWNRA